jgi:hypothetical protein
MTAKDRRQNPERYQRSRGGRRRMKTLRSSYTAVVSKNSGDRIVCLEEVGASGDCGRDQGIRCDVERSVAAMRRPAAAAIPPFRPGTDQPSHNCWDAPSAYARAKRRSGEGHRTSSQCDTVMRVRAAIPGVFRCRTSQHELACRRRWTSRGAQDRRILFDHPFDVRGCRRRRGQACQRRASFSQNSDRPRLAHTPTAL